MEYFDVIIIGAGPAGLKCAEVLGNSKFSVLLLEKNAEIGVKVCAGGLLVKNSEYLNLPKEIIDSRFDKIKLHIKNTSSTLNYHEDFVYTIDRKKLGQWQLQKLKQFENIEIRKNCKVSKIEKNYIHVKGKKISYKKLIGADGSNSIVKRYLGIKSKSVDIAIQYIIPTKKYKEFEIFFDPNLFSAWYAWIFPHKDYVSIGCGCNPKIISSKKIINNFHNWLDKNSVDISNGKYEAFSLDYNFQGYQFESIFLIGDAGGFVSGLTGEGIYPAIVSGEEIGKTILNPKYKSKKIDRLLQVKKKHNRIMHFLINCGNLKFFLFFYCQFLLLKIPYFKKKALNFST